MNQNLTEEKIANIREREAKALAFLKELELTPAAYVVKESLGEDRFVDKVIPYLQDIKYAEQKPVLSPLNNI